MRALSRDRESIALSLRSTSCSLTNRGQVPLCPRVFQRLLIHCAIPFRFPAAAYHITGQSGSMSQRFVLFVVFGESLPVRHAHQWAVVACGSVVDRQRLASFKERARHASPGGWPCPQACTCSRVIEATRDVGDVPAYRSSGDGALVASPAPGTTVLHLAQVVLDRLPKHGQPLAGRRVQERIDMVDIAYSPAQLTVPANTDVTLTVTNTGVLQHSFTMDNPQLSSGVLNSGASTTLTLNLPPGVYQFYCSVPGHREAGMVGTIVAE